MLKVQEDDEKKKREEEAKSIISSASIGDTINTINYANLNGISLNVQNEYEQNFINKVNEANNIINSINPRQNVPAPSASDEEMEKGHQNAQKLLDLMDKNSLPDEINTDITTQQENSNANSRFRINQSKTKEEIDEQIKQASNQNIKANTESGSTNNINRDTNNVVDNDVKIGLASQEETQNAQELSTSDIKAMAEANEKNKAIEKGGLEKFEAQIDTFFDNILGGVKQTVSGLANVLTTGAALGLRGLEGASKILGFESTGNALNEAYNNVIKTGSDLSEKANYERTVTSQIDDDFTSTMGNVTNVISNMASSQLIGMAIPHNIPGATIQGLSVGGSSAQEVLDENKENITQATLTGIAKGYTSYLTEKMFDANILTKGAKKTSIQTGVDKMISKRISSELGKEVANKSVGIIGENLEELAEDNAGYLIDKLINNKDLPGFQEWWDNTTETTKVTTISTLVMSLIGLGGESFHNKEVDMEADYWIDQAKQIVKQENLAIQFNPSETMNINDVKEFFITRFTEDGEIANIIPTRGKPIANPNQDLNVKPIIVKDNITNYYNVIDEDTGVILDSTFYSTTMEAESGFDEKVLNLSDLQVRNINQKINNANITITNQFTNVIEQARAELGQMKTINNTNINQENNIAKTENRINTLSKTINNISDKRIFNQNQTDTIFDTVSNNIQNIEYVKEDSGGGILYSFDTENNITGEQKIDSKVYTGKKIKSIFNTALQNADTIVTTESNTNNTPKATQDKNASTFYSNETNYAVQDIKKVTEPFSKQETYSKEEMADVWNDEISENNYDAYYNKDGNIERYIAIEEDGNNIVVNQYDNNDNVVKSEIIPNENGRYSAKDIQDTINRVASIYDENRPIKGQQDIEGNEVKNMKKNNKNKDTTLALPKDKGVANSR